MIKKLSESDIKESMKLGKTYQNRYEEIVNSFESKLDNGFVEGYNNKIKVIKRVSYGVKKIRACEKKSVNKKSFL